MAEVENTVLVNHWPTITWRSAANWAAWLSAVLPDVLLWIAEQLKLIPPDLVSDGTKHILGMVLVSVAVPVARAWKQEALARALAKKEAENAR